MSASDLSPFVAAVIQDGIVAEMKEQIEEFQRREENHLKVQITGHGGSPIYGETSLKEGRTSTKDYFGLVLNDCWSIDTHHCNNPCIFPFDEETLAQLEIRVGGFILLKQFWRSHAGLVFKRYSPHANNEPYTLGFEIGPSQYDHHNNIPIHTVYARLGLAASSSTSMDDKNTFVSLIKSFGLRTSESNMLHHFRTLVNVNDERGGGTKLTMTIERIVFRKNFISVSMSRLNEIGIQTNPPFVRRG